MRLSAGYYSQSYSSLVGVGKGVWDILIDPCEYKLKNIEKEAKKRKNTSKRSKRKRNARRVARIESRARKGFAVS
jgi:hypothetical protein